MRCLCVGIFLLLLSGSFAQAQKNNQQPVRQQRAAPVRQPALHAPMQRQQRMVNPNAQRQVNRQQLQNQVRGANSGRASPIDGSKAGLGSSAVAATPRAQLLNQVKPVGAAIKPANHISGGPGGHPASMTKAPIAPRAGDNFRRPAHIAHNSGHHIGRAGARFNHRAFSYGRGGHYYHRRYYVEGGVWFWYDDPIEAGDPLYAAIENAQLPECEADADECS